MHRVVAQFLIGTVAASAAGLAFVQSSAVGRPAAPARLALRQDAEAAPAPDEAHAPVGDRLMGVATCTSTACHHANGPRGTWRSEYTTWAAHDKHARAYDVLFDDRSERIARNLQPELFHVGGQVKKITKAYERKLCLNCHSSRHESVGVFTEPDGTEKFRFADGVGCESCHGPAERWLSKHYTNEMLGLDAVQKEQQFGLRNTKDLVVRAGICTDCHVGNPSRGMEVNHDLIAAGHPRLNFEYSGYLHMYARHWQYNSKDLKHPGDKDRHPDFEARTWIIGQLASARSAVEQLVQRADGSKSNRQPWPEFAEFSCFACHKDLSVIPTVDGKPNPYFEKYKNRTPGALTWGTWYAPVLTLDGGTVRFPDALTGDLAELQRLMERPGTPAEPVAKQGRAVVERLSRELAEFQARGTLTKSDVDTLLRELAGVAKSRAPGFDWDQAAKYYLGLAALNAGLCDLDPASPLVQPLRTDIRSIGWGLKKSFEPGYDSPSRFQKERPNIEARFGAIHSHLTQ